MDIGYTMLEEKCKNCIHCSWNSWSGGWFCERLDDGEDEVNLEDFCKVISSIFRFEEKENK
jgi:hypothetical protein